MLEENLAILVRTLLHKHGTLIPESLHAESQWDRPKRVEQEVGRSELGEPVPWRGSSAAHRSTRDHVAVSAEQT